MQKKIRIITLLLALICIMSIPQQAKAALTSTDVIKNARTIYYSTQKKIKNKTYKDSGVKGIYKEYMSKNKIRLTIMYPGNGDMDVNNCTCEYYYDKNEKLVFAFAYKKVKGKKKEYRAYYGTNGNLYRYIDPNGKVTTYKKGKAPGNNTTMAERLYAKGIWNIAVAHEG